MSNFNIRAESQPADLVAAEGRYILSEREAAAHSDAETQAPSRLPRTAKALATLAVTAAVGAVGYIGLERENAHLAAVDAHNRSVATHIQSQKWSNQVKQQPAHSPDAIPPQ